MSFVLAGVVAALFLVADQLTKYIVMTNMELYQKVDFIDGFMNFTYIHNNGGAWGMLGGYTWVLIAVTALIMVGLIVALIKIGRNSRLFFHIPLLVFISFAMIELLARILVGRLIKRNAKSRVITIHLPSFSGNPCLYNVSHIFLSIII